VTSVSSREFSDSNGGRRIGSRRFVSRFDAFRMRAFTLDEPQRRPRLAWAPGAAGPSLHVDWIASATVGRRMVPKKGLEWVSSSFEDQ